MTTPSLCPNPERCGSCGWSHIPYDKQLQQKMSDINGSFAIKKLDLTVNEILSSPKTAHYRNRMDFVIDFQGNVGLREKGKWWRVIDDHPCFLADEKIDDLFAAVRAWAKAAGISYYDRKANAGILRYAVIRATTLGETMITVVTSAPDEGRDGPSGRLGIEAALRDLADITKATTVVWAVNHTITDVSFGDDLRVITGDGVIHETVDGMRYRISPNAFFQTNSYAAPLLLATVREFAGDLTNKTLLDLYCGTGFFAIALANGAKRTVGVEMVPEAIVDAQKNAALNNVTVEFHDAKTESYDWKAIGADVVILDPPRGGMVDKALADVIAAKPERIVYVSCNYKNFAREMVQLQHLYDVVAIRAVDMFPHTPHVELVAALVRK